MIAGFPQIDGKYKVTYKVSLLPHTAPMPY